jgi:membrane protein YdbS with pleckstrin-like domain
MFSVSVKGPLPLAITRHLLPWEATVLATRRHPVTIAGPLIAGLAGALVALLLTAIAIHNGVGQEVVWALWLILAGWAVWKYANWRATYFVVTEKRLVLYSGVLTKTVGMMPMSKVTDHRVMKTPLDRLFNCATFLMETAGPDQALRQVTWLPYADQLELELLALLFPNPDHDESASDGGGPAGPDPGF